MAHTPRTHAAAAGVLYLTTHVTSVLAVAAYGSGLLAWGVLLELGLAVGCVGTGVLLWLLLRGTGPARAATFALLRTVEAAVILAGTLPMLATAWLHDASVGSAPDGRTTASSGATAGLTAVISDALDRVHTASFLVGQGLVISVNTIVLGWLLLDSRAVPRALALLGLAGGGLVLTSNLAQLFGAISLNGAVAGACAAPVFAFEVWLAVLLIVRGLRAAPPPSTMRTDETVPRERAADPA